RGRAARARPCRCPARGHRTGCADRLHEGRSGPAFQSFWEFQASIWACRNESVDLDALMRESAWAKRDTSVARRRSCCSTSLALSSLIRSDCSRYRAIDPASEAGLLVSDAEREILSKVA